MIKAYIRQHKTLWIASPEVLLRTLLSSDAHLSEKISWHFYENLTRKFRKSHEIFLKNSWHFFVALIILYWFAAEVTLKHWYRRLAAMHNIGIYDRIEKTGISPFLAISFLFLNWRDTPRLAKWMPESAEILCCWRALYIPDRKLL